MRTKYRKTKRYYFYTYHRRTEICSFSQTICNNQKEALGAPWSIQTHSWSASNFRSIYVRLSVRPSFTAMSTVNIPLNKPKHWKLLRVGTHWKWAKSVQRRAYNITHTDNISAFWTFLLITYKLRQTQTKRKILQNWGNSATPTQYYRIWKLNFFTFLA